jgi:hypothetical protein
MGFVVPRSAIQIDDLDDGSRTDLWNVVFNVRKAFSGRASTQRHPSQIAQALWARHFRWPIDQFNEVSLWSSVKDRLLKAPAQDALWTVEDFVRAVASVANDQEVDTIVSVLNNELESNLVGYRFIDKQLVPVTSDGEVQAVTGALAATIPFAGAHKNLQNALALLAAKPDPQYAKSIHESVSAVEAIVRNITGAKTLGDGLKALEKNGLQIHKALESAWLKLYGYSSDAAGIRHGSIEDSEANEALASYMLVSCSAFVNLLLKLSVSGTTT